MKNENKTEDKKIITYDDVFFMVLMITFLGFVIYFGFKFHHNFKISQEVIKYSEEYTIFNECTEIQGKYYCK